VTDCNFNIVRCPCNGLCSWSVTLISTLTLHYITLVYDAWVVKCQTCGYLLSHRDLSPLAAPNYAVCRQMHIQSWMKVERLGVELATKWLQIHWPDDCTSTLHVRLKSGKSINSGTYADVIPIKLFWCTQCSEEYFCDIVLFIDFCAVASRFLSFLFS